MNHDEFAPIAEAFGLPYPDISEDALLGLQSAFISFGFDVQDIGNPVVHLLSELQAASSSKAVDSLVSHWSDIQRDFLLPFGDLCEQIAHYTLDAYDVVRGLKAGILGIADVEAGVALYTGGVSAAVTLAARRVAGAELRKTIEGLINDALHRLQSEVFGRIAAAVDDLKALAQRAVATATTKTVTAAVDQIPWATGAGQGPAAVSFITGKLHLSAETLESRARAIVNVIEACDGDAKQLDSALVALMHPASVVGQPDHAIRAFVGQFFTEVVNDTKTAALQTCQNLLNHQSGLVSIIGDRITQVDAELAGAARPLFGSATVQAAGGVALLTGGTIVATFDEGSAGPVSDAASSVPAPQAAEDQYGTPASAYAVYQQRAIAARYWGDDPDQCTSWANFRRAQLDLSTNIRGDGGQMVGGTRSGDLPSVAPSQASLGSLVSEPAAGAGHVMVVEKVVNSTPGHYELVVSEMNTHGKGTPGDLSLSSRLVENPAGTWTIQRPDGRSKVYPNVLFSTGVTG
jgi:surface antigen